jgi:PPOX class probable F420-dependent enzyme
MAKLPKRAVDLLKAKNLAYLATCNEDGSPHVAPLWVDVDEERGLILLDTADGRRKVRNIRRDPRVAISAHDPEHPWPPLVVRGEAMITTEGADELIDFLCRKYSGKPWEPVEGQVRLVIEVHPGRISFPRD